MSLSYVNQNAILIDKDSIHCKFIIRLNLLASDELGRLLAVVVEVPQADLLGRRDNQLVVLVIHVDCLRVRLELEEKLLRDEVVLVDQAVHCDQEEVPVRL